MKKNPYRRSFAPIVLSMLLAMMPLLLVASTAAPAPVGARLAPTAEEPRVLETTQVDSATRAIAEAVMDAMGGRQAWDATRFVSWNFFGGAHQHYWDKWTGDLRIEIAASDRGPETLVLMNLDKREGRVWIEGAEVTDTAALDEIVDRGWRFWVNDAYWMFMPYKLLDPGVNLRLEGEGTMEDGRDADILELTFEGVGVTPENRYLVYVARDTGLIEQWSYFQDRDDEEPGFTGPWAGWQRFGGILLATDHGRGADWDIRVHDELPAEIFLDPGFRLE